MHTFQKFLFQLENDGRLRAEVLEVTMPLLSSLDLSKD